jgi:protein-S-isoprenylcysteine O-methyltransferase Ste14
MTENDAYGLWALVVLNSVIFIALAFSFTKPKSAQDWRSLGTFSAFVVALFVEMYGFPLTIYLLAGWLQTRYPATDIFSHNAGHLWNTLFGWNINPHFDPFHLLSYVLIILGLTLLAKSWRILHEAQKRGELATTGPYERVRHPQYVAFILIMFGFLLQWPTLLTLVIFPILVYVYMRLAQSEELSAMEAFGDRYLAYVERTPGFLPSLKSFFRDKTQMRGG